MILKPSLGIGYVEVIAVDKKLKSVSLVVHVPKLHRGDNPPEVKKWVSGQLNNAVKYLVAEGFVTEPLNSWSTNIGTIIH